MRVRLDRTVCDGFGLCGAYAPEVFSLDEWGYASLVDPAADVAPDREPDVRRAVRDCPVRAIVDLSGEDGDTGVPPRG